MALTYAVITPTRDELENLRRLAPCLLAQTVRPRAWLVVDNGSQDGTPEYVRELADRHPWVRLVREEPDPARGRGAPIVRAFHRGVSELDVRPDVVVKLDADISMEPDYFERLVQAFDSDPRIGIASGTGLERDAEGAWRVRTLIPEQAWGANRAYRAECLEDVLPLEEAMGWDGIDQVKAAVYGWWTGTIDSIQFRHHRFEGERDGAPTAGWEAQGRASYYMGYRFSYLLLRALHHGLRDRSALALIRGYLAAALTRSPRCPDEDVRSRLRDQQRMREVVARLPQLLASGGPARRTARDRHSG